MVGGYLGFERNA